VEYDFIHHWNGPERFYRSSAIPDELVPHWVYDSEIRQWAISEGLWIGLYLYSLYYGLKRPGEDENGVFVELRSVKFRDGYEKNRIIQVFDLDGNSATRSGPLGPFTLMKF